jgi:hypothetical protein
MNSAAPNPKNSIFLSRRAPGFPGSKKTPTFRAIQVSGNAVTGKWGFSDSGIYDTFRVFYVIAYACFIRTFLKSARIPVPMLRGLL